MLRYGDHPDQVVELRGDPAHPLVAVVHGGFWRPAFDRTHAGAQSDALADAGFRVATVEYRRIPGDPDAAIGDVRAALAAVDGRAVVVGHSAGGQLALLLAAVDPPVRAVVALGPVASLRLAEALDLGDGAVADHLGAPAAARPDLDPLELPDPAVPVTILHGADDRVVPLEVSEAYVARHPSTALIVLPGAGHFPGIDPRAPEFGRVIEVVRALAIGG